MCVSGAMIRFVCDMDLVRGRQRTYKSRKEEPILASSHNGCLNAEFTCCITGAIDCPVCFLDNAPAIFRAHKYCSNPYP